MIDTKPPRERVPLTEEQLAAAWVEAPPVLNAPIEIVDYDPAWPAQYEREAARIRAALGDRVVLLEHVGSTSVPGLPAKPKLDILLAVPNAGDEPAYVPALEAAGYVLRIREPDWFEHRLFGGPDVELNLHVFSKGCSELDRMLVFRNWLRSNAADRALYADTKRELAKRTWKYMQNYADAKNEVIDAIMARAWAAMRFNQAGVNDWDRGE